METKTIIYLVAAALILRVVLKVIVRYAKDKNVSYKDDRPKEL